MDVAREHLWGQLLLQRRLVEEGGLLQLVAERDARLRQGQECTLGQLLVQRRQLDAQTFGSLRSEVEERGRACYRCRRVFLVEDGASQCPGCGQDCRLAPPGSGSRPAVQAGSARFPAPGSDRFPAGGPASGRFPGATFAPAPGSGRFAASPLSGPLARPVPPSGSFTSAAPAASGSFVGPAGAFAASGSFAPAPSGAFAPFGLASGGASYPQGGVPSTVGEVEIDGGLGDSGELGVGKRLGGYEIIKELGRGGMGVVYQARSIAAPAQVVAVKVLLAGEFASPRLRKRFEEEARLAKKLRHPNIVAVHDVGDVDGLPYYAMDFVEGQELQELIRSKSLPIRRGVEVLVEIAKAAHHAHENGVVHRDLKPANILVGNDGRPYIMDFGLAKNLEDDQGLTKSGVAIGTPYYMPPEQARGNSREMDARSDVYAMGAILYEVLTRKVPFTAKTQNELLRKIIDEEPVPCRQVRAGIPPELEVICLKALQKEKERRYASALELAEDLERYLAGDPIKARPPAPWVPLLRKIRRNQTASIVVGSAAFAVVIAFAIIAGLYSHHQSTLAADQLEDERRATEAAARAAEEARQREEEERARRLEEEKRSRAEAALARGQDAYAAARSALTSSEARRHLRGAETAFTEAALVEEGLGAPRPDTLYRRALARRGLCAWEKASEDLERARGFASHAARAGLGLGLIALRRDADRAAAERWLAGATAASGAGDGDEGREERAAGEVAAIYLAFLREGYEPAKRLAHEALGRGALGTLAGEVHGALAYLERAVGAPLGGDEHVDAGLRAADRAVAYDRHRFDFLLDRAVLRARAGQLVEAQEDQRAALDLDSGSELVDLAEAAIWAGRRDAKQLEQALAAAARKAAARPGAAERVRAQGDALRAALADAAAAQREARTLDRDFAADLTFNGGGSPRSALPVRLRVGDDVTAVLITIRGGADDLDLFVKHGEELSSLGEADFKSTGSSPDETLLLERARGRLRSGIYTVVIVQPPSSRGKVKAKLAVDFVAAGEPLPFVWEEFEGISVKAEERVEVIELLRRFDLDDDRPAVLARFEALERVNPWLAMFRVDLLYRSERYAEALALAKTLAKRAPDDERWSMRVASCEFHTAARDAALSRLEALARALPRNVEVRRRLAELALAADPARGLAAAEAGLALAPDGILTLLAGRAELRLGRTPAAVQRLRAMIEAVPTPREDQSRGLLLLIEERQLLPAQASLEALAARGPRLDLELVRARLMAEQGDPKAGLAHLALLKTRVQSPQAHALIESVARELEAKFPGTQ